MALPIIGPAISASIISAASQGINTALGLQDRVEWKGVASAGISAGVSDGLGRIGGPVGKFLNGSGLPNIIIKAAIKSVITQGISTVTGLQKKFSWTNVAVAGATAGAEKIISDELGAPDNDIEEFGKKIIVGAAGLIAGEAARSLIKGTDFGDYVLAALPDLIEDSLADSLAPFASQAFEWLGRAIDRSSGPVATPRPGPAPQNQQQVNLQQRIDQAVAQRNEAELRAIVEEIRIDIAPLLKEAIERNERQRAATGNAGPAATAVSGGGGSKVRYLVAPEDSSGAGATGTAAPAAAAADSENATTVKFESIEVSYVDGGGGFYAGTFLSNAANADLIGFMAASYDAFGVDNVTGQLASDLEAYPVLIGYFALLNQVGAALSSFTPINPKAGVDRVSQFSAAASSLWGHITPPPEITVTASKPRRRQSDLELAMSGQLEVQNAQVQAAGARELGRQIKRGWNAFGRWSNTPTGNSRPVVYDYMTGVPEADIQMVINPQNLPHLNGDRPETNGDVLNAALAPLELLPPLKGATLLPALGRGARVAGHVDEVVDVAGDTARVTGTAADVLEAFVKGPLRRSEADVRGVRRFDPNIPAHANGAMAEEQLARTVHALDGQTVLRWGDPIGSHGSDVISVNYRTGEVFLWDAKFRTAGVRLQESGTFKSGSPARANAFREARETIEADRTLPAAIRTQALANLRNNQVFTRTVGFGNARNSVTGR